MLKRNPVPKLGQKNLMLPSSEDNIKLTFEIHPSGESPLSSFLSIDPLFLDNCIYTITETGIVHEGISPNLGYKRVNANDKYHPDNKKSFDQTDQRTFYFSICLPII
ncbi:MAG: hypothetical protein DWQ02_14350 [Bacteroidetes bacterium]|nr:MAG: hypothetical protein DWQ02_14350 [Bacteroidota bacterium]